MQSQLLVDEAPAGAANQTSLDTAGGDDRLPISGVQEFEQLLIELTGIERSLSTELTTATAAVFEQLGPADVDAAQVRSRFFGRLNQKLTASREILRDIYSHAAAQGLVFNYPTKIEIAWAIDSGDADLYATTIRRESSTNRSLANELVARFKSVSQTETRRLVLAEAQKPTKLRKARDRDVALDVFEAAAGPLLWSLWAPQVLRDVFRGGQEQVHCTDNYLSDLRAEQPELFNRDRALVVRFVQPKAANYEAERDDITGWLSEEYKRLSNYGFLAVVLDCDVEPAAAWQLSADLTLFAERFNENPLRKLFFRAEDVERETREHIPGLDLKAARFDLINEGFTYRDLFVLAGDDRRARRLLLIFQNNQRDESLIPCPACRSSNVAGNSYPSLGVKSWECRNALCPERSIYNRGKRYSFKALLAQAAIEDPENDIPIANVRQWQRDVLDFPGDPALVSTLVHHYSMSGDTVVLMNPAAGMDKLPSGRTVVMETPPSTSPPNAFWRDAAFFARYAIAPTERPAATERSVDISATRPWTVLEGDAFAVLSRVPDATFNCAITSPPYFNARAYAQWPNIYCYLHDMMRINRQVFRTLKHGGFYAYNIFDYFDNERTIVFSDMGRKRIALSAMMLDIFRRIGFDFAGTLVWDKGDIHGKRGFNAGNFSPFYQSPFNCWEHVLLLEKPSVDASVGYASKKANQILRLHPVVKMIRGENTLGHTAPFPIGLPEALLDGTPDDTVVLDPFAGSGTTGRAALNAGVRTVLVERDPEYANLARRLLQEHENDLQAAPSALW
jgi:DNA modification methylase